MWSIYLSVYQVGQAFLHQQWDLLLLEAGFLAILLAPLTPAKSKATNPSDPLVFLLLRFLLFRVLVSATVLKLKNRSPAWWSLTGIILQLSNLSTELISSFLQLYQLITSHRPFQPTWPGIFIPSLIGSTKPAL